MVPRRVVQMTASASRILAIMVLLRSNGSARVIASITLVIALAAAITVILATPWGSELFRRIFVLSGEGVHPVVAFEETTRNVAAGIVFSIPWRTEAIDEPGAFVLSYPCGREDLAVSFSDGTSIPCGAHVPIADHSPLELIAKTESAGTVPLTLSVGFIPEGSPDPITTSTAVITVEAGETMPPVAVHPPSVSSPDAAQPSAGAPSTATYHFPTGSNTAVTSGAADLFVRVVDVGVADAATGTFLRSGPAKRGEHAALVFEIENIGGAVSPAWHFTTDLPTGTSYHFVSETQNPLGPRDKVRFTLGFDDMRNGTSTGLVIVHPETGDANHSNDSTVATFVRID